ncbi:430_t:CDS:2, partial [Cetraspora pellucida]
MSTTGKTISLPTINEVEGYKTTKALIKFLDNQDIGLDDNNFKILCEQKVDSEMFLSLNVDKLMQDGLKRGPAKKIYLTSEVYCISSSAWKDFGQLYDYLKNCIDFVSPLENYKFIVGDKEMNFGKVNEPSKDLSYHTYHTRSEDDEEIVQKAFNRTFQDLSNFLERFIQFIDKCLDDYETIKGSVKYLFAFDEARTLVGKNAENTVDINFNSVNFKEAMTLKDDTKGMEPEHIIELAMDKLIGGQFFNVWRKNLIKILDTLTILRPHLCVKIAPQSEYVPDLIANNMHLCIKVLDDHKYIVTVMPTEPVLAEASAQIMNNSHISLTELINKLSEALKKGIIET